jgi:hypothetical protein
MRRGSVLTLATVVVLTLGLGVASARSVASLSPPDALQAIAIGDTSVSLAWHDTNTRESGYEVAQSLDPTRDFVVVARPRRK